MLNMVERWFRELSDKDEAIRRAVFPSVRALIAAIEDYLKANNDNLEPFVWTATAPLPRPFWRRSTAAGWHFRQWPSDNETLHRPGVRRVTGAGTARSSSRPGDGADGGRPPPDKSPRRGSPPCPLSGTPGGPPGDIPPAGITRSIRLRCRVRPDPPLVGEGGPRGPEGRPPSTSAAGSRP